MIWPPGHVLGPKTCQKQHRQNEPAFQVNISTGVEICVMGILDTCRDHRRLTTCQKQHRQNEPAGQETFQLGWKSVQWGIQDMYRDHRHLIGCQKKYRQNELAGWVEVPTGVDVRVTADPRHM